MEILRDTDFCRVEVKNLERHLSNKDISSCFASIETLGYFHYRLEIADFAIRSKLEKLEVTI